MDRLIAIDGPAASGKSSVARAVARRLNFSYVNSGTMYRAVTWHLLQSGIDLEDIGAIQRAIERVKITFEFVGDELRVRIDGVDPSAHLREEAVNSAVSRVSAVPRLREIVLPQLRQAAAGRDVVMEGRDIGSVVFPHTPFKFYIDASADVRKQRRLAEGVRDEIASRDLVDSSRLAAPLVVAPDAELIDSSRLTLDQVVDEILCRLVDKNLHVVRTQTRIRMKGWYRLGYFLSKVIGKIFFHYRVIHPERMIESGPAILAMNHQSYLDPPLAGIACKRPIFFLARKTLLDVPLLGRLLPKINVIPVDQEGGDRSALKALVRILRAGEATLVFPEGSRTLDGKLQPAEPGLGFIIAKTLAPVVPMRIFGAFEAWRRNSKTIRPGRITVVIGEPMRFTATDVAEGGKELYRGLSQRVMDEIAKLTING